MAQIRYTRIIGDITFTANNDLNFPQGQLPVGKRIIEVMVALLRPEEAGKVQRQMSVATLGIAQLLIEHCEFCNIYIQTQKVVKSKIEN